MDTHCSLLRPFFDNDCKMVLQHWVQEFTLKSLRLKPDKWARMVVSDEQRNFINNFIERQSPQVRLDPSYVVS
jgi:hypothetical protein